MEERKELPQKDTVFKKDPRINVIVKEDFEDRVKKVFHEAWETLARSFGPYGAPTIIYNYPYSHVTKDGYTIMKNLSMDASEQLVDQAIFDMAADICGRLNYTVGDGTTTAVISTNSIYQNYMEKRDDFKKNMILPRDILAKYEVIKNEVIADLQNRVRVIRSDDFKELRQNIYDVVYISSNGDEQMSTYIADLYEKLGFPAITATMADDGITKSRLVEGYQYELLLTDRTYINSDNNIMHLENADVIIFSTKVDLGIYTDILKPLSQSCKIRGRHLIVAAPVYDEVALSKTIARDLNNEYTNTNDINMVLTTYKAISAHTRNLINDFAILTNATVIDKNVLHGIQDTLASGVALDAIFNMDHRDIKGNMIVGYCEQPDKDKPAAVKYVPGVDSIPDTYKPLPLIDDYISVGFVGTADVGLKSSLFTGFHYDAPRYDVAVKDAEATLKSLEDKYAKLGTFNIEVAQAQQRLYALRLKMGVIEVGGDSELSKRMTKDAIDDAVKAATSAFNHGVISGCNLDLILSIEDVIKKYKEDEVANEIEILLLNILMNGFIDVYKTVLRNAFEDQVIVPSDRDLTKQNFLTFLKDVYPKLVPVIEEMDEEFFKESAERNPETDITIHDIIVAYSIKTGKVYDVSTMEYSNTVINSAQTDEEVLKATIDLISLLITGNQMIVTQKHNF